MIASRSSRSTLVGAALFLYAGGVSAQPGRSREDWGAPVVSVTREGELWTIAGRRNKAVLDPRDLTLRVEAGPVRWVMAASSTDDMELRSRGEEFPARLADAGRIEITRFDTGYKTGVKIALSRFRHGGPRHKDVELDLALYLTVCFEGKDEDLVFDVVARERETEVRRLDWPKPLDARDVDLTVLSNARGTLLPRDWPKVYSPFRPSDAELKAKPIPRDVIESNLIECWSMSWWGFERKPSAMMLIVETPDDAAYTFEHPAGGPTVIGPRWNASLGSFRYPRSARMVFFEKGNYVTMAKRYRRYVRDTGQFVSLREKIVAAPIVEALIGTPHIRLHVLKNYKVDAFRYDHQNPASNYGLTTFDQRAAELRRLKAKGIDRLYVCLAGWIYMGYDRQHPDVMPPAPQAGGWEGLQRFAATMKELNYLFVPHEQYVDYYLDAPSFQEQFAVHDEDSVRPPARFPGTRMKEWKTGHIPYMDNWDGGAQSYLSPWLMPGHLRKNYALMFEHGIRPDGAYLDVFGYLPPHDDFNPEHPVNHEESLRYRALCYRWVRNNLGIVGTEAAADWAIPYVDLGSANPGQGRAIPVPLYELVYHDAIVLPYGSNSEEAEGIALLHGGVPQIWGGDRLDDEGVRRAKRIAALHARVGLSEMTNHEFLDASRRKERTTFADGTTVTFDRDSRQVTITPEL